ncbi:response regulator transcription factor [Paenibacillus koleovorans]|uniref:response regulator transcription factor n=1 Tax=Paenibacillus koleovorans TaxID=121608 RepID=UPI000FD8F877|nr:response regulator transcription factor [Paenibacillus koleovorans]
MPGRILLIEDEDRIARVLELELKHEQYETVRAADGKTGLELALADGWDIILLDVMLPELDGMDVLRQLRAQGSTVPIIMLTARDAVKDKVTGLDLGADDYVTKPFAIEELLARIRRLIHAVSRLHSADTAEVLGLDGLRVESRSRQVTRDGQPIELTPTEFDLLLYLLRHAGTVLTREQILAEVWGYDFVGDTNLVDVYIRYLRQKVDKGYKVKLIHTSRGVGYFVRDAV